MKRTFLPVLSLLIFMIGCSSRSPDYVPPDWKMGQRRGRGVEPRHLHDSFILARDVLSAPGAPQHVDIDPSLRLAEDLWFAGDRDFAAALSKEPANVRRAVAHYLLTNKMVRDFPRTHALLSAAARPYGRTSKALTRSAWILLVTTGRSFTNQS